MTKRLPDQTLRAALDALTPIEKTLQGKECIHHLISEIQGAPYTVEQAIWNRAPNQLQLLLWKLSGCDSDMYGTRFKREWLELNIEAKRKLSDAIRQLFEYVDHCRALLVAEIQSEAAQ